jgi:hypothetical protein
MNYSSPFSPFVFPTFFGYTSIRKMASYDAPPVTTSILYLNNTREEWRQQDHPYVISVTTKTATDKDLGPRYKSIDCSSRDLPLNSGRLLEEGGENSKPETRWPIRRILMLGFTECWVRRFAILDKEKPVTESTKGLDLATVMFMTVQVSRLPLWPELQMNSRAVSSRD